MLKKIVCFMLTVLITMGLLGCSQTKQTGNPGGKTSKGSIVSKPTKLKLSYWEPGTAKEMQNSLSAIVDEYKKVQPDITIELLPQPYQGYQDWIKTRFAAGDAPDIQENSSKQLEDQHLSGLLFDIKDAYNSPNAYADNKIWKDIFIDGKLGSAHNYLYEPSFAVPYSGLGIAYYYNKDIYSQLGLNVPKTWDEFMSNCEKIKETKINPISLMMMKKDAVDWMSWYIVTGLFSNKYLADAKFNPNGDRFIADQELARAVELGYYDLTKGDERKMLDKYFDLIEQVSKYADGANGLDEAGAKAQFLAGKSGHLMSGSWDIKSFVIEPTTKINLGVFSLPSFSKQNGEFAGDNMTISSVQSMAITNSVKSSEDKQKAAVDFLKFLTAPQNYKKFVDIACFVPVVKGVDTNEAFYNFTKGTLEPLGILGRSTSKSKTTLQNATFLAMGKQEYNRDNIAVELQKSIKEWSQETMTKYSISKDNDFGVSKLPKRGEFVPSVPAQ